MSATMPVVANRSISRDGYTAEWQTITPEMAAAFLADAAPNRNQTEAYIQAFVESVENDEYRTGAGTILFDEQGRLIDGQHRCEVIVRSGVALEMLVVRGVPTNVQEVVDRNRARSLADILALRGFFNARDCAGIVRALHVYGRTGEVISSGNRKGVSDIRLATFAEESRDLIEVAARAAKSLRERDPGLPIPPRVYGAVYAVASSKTSTDEIMGYFNQLISPDDEASAPAVARARLLRLGPSEPGSYSLDRLKAVIVIKGWNAWISGAQPKRLSWRPGGANPEPAPAIAGYPGEDTIPHKF